MLHNFEEFFEAQATICFEGCIGNQIMCLVRVPTQTFYDSLQVIYVYESGLFPIKHVKDAAEVFNLLLRVLLKYIVALILLLVHVHIGLSDSFISIKSSYIIIILLVCAIIILV